MVEFEHVPALAQMRMLGGFGHREDRRHRSASSLAFFHDLVLTVLHRPFFDQRVNQVGVLGAREHVLKHFRLHPFGVAHHFGDTVPLPRFEGKHPNVPVLTRDDGGGRTERHAHARALFELPVLRVATNVLPAHKGGGDRFRTRHVHMLTHAGVLAPVNSGESP